RKTRNAERPTDEERDRRVPVDLPAVRSPECALRRLSKTRSDAAVSDSVSKRRPTVRDARPDRHEPLQGRDPVLSFWLLQAEGWTLQGGYHAAPGVSHGWKWISGSVWKGLLDSPLCPGVFLP